MVSICLNCRKSTGIGEEGGAIGLPSLDEKPRGAGDHVLYKALTGYEGGDAADTETFGYIYSGFREIGLIVHCMEVYKQFLQAHSGAGHRLYEWQEEHDDPPAGYEGLEDHVFKLYSRPKQVPGYVFAKVAFDCQACGRIFESNAPEWVQPFEPHVVPQAALLTFKARGVDPGEMNMHDAYPFDINYVELSRWLDACGRHPVTLRLVQESIERWGGRDDDEDDDDEDGAED